MHVLFGSLLALSLVSCGTDPAPSPVASTPSPSASPSPSTSPSPDTSGGRWIAVVDVAREPDDLDALTERLREPLGTALVVSPTDCFEGLPNDVASGYLIGAVGDSRAEVEELVLDAGEEVAFSARVTSVCMD